MYWALFLWYCPRNNVLNISSMALPTRWSRNPVALCFLPSKHYRSKKQGGTGVSNDASKKQGDRGWHKYVYVWQSTSRVLRAWRPDASRVPRERGRACRARGGGVIMFCHGFQIWHKKWIGNQKLTRSVITKHETGPRSTVCILLKKNRENGQWPRRGGQVGERPRGHWPFLQFFWGGYRLLTLDLFRVLRWRIALTFHFLFISVVKYWFHDKTLFWPSPTPAWQVRTSRVTGET